MGPWLRSAGLVVGSTLVFGALRWALRRSPLPTHVRNDATRTWRWRNLLVSFVHSIVAGIWAVRGAWQAVSSLLSGIFLERFVGAGLVSLFVEVSNIFLTLRMMMRLGNLHFPLLYQVNKYVNLVAYFLFRLAPQAYLTWYFVRYVEVRGQGGFLIVNLFLLDFLILAYFSRLLRSDFFSDSRQWDPDSEKKFLSD